jgi:hypothetical protein
MEPIIPIAAIGLLLLLRKKKARKPSIPGVPGNGPKRPGPGKPPGKKPTPGTPKRPGDPGQPGAPDPERRYQWGDGPIPEDWDFDSNQFWISPDCETVLEGWHFETYGYGVGVNAIEAPTLVDALAQRSAPDVEKPDNSVYGYLSYLTDVEGLEILPPDFAMRVMFETNPLCADAYADQDMEDWPPGLMEWFDSFVERTTEPIEEATGILFEP